MSAAETRQRLIDQARTAFAAKGHDNVSVQRDILQPAGVSNGSFYHQFSDKTDLLVAVLEDGRDRARTVIEDGLAGSTNAPAPERMKQRMLLWLKVIEHGEDMIRIQIREQHNEDERVRNLLADFHTGSFAPLAQRLADSITPTTDTFDPQRAALFARQLFQSVALTYLDMPQDQREAEREELARDMTAFVIGGISNMAGINHNAKAKRS